jgi:hypothetical protein
LVRTKDKTNTEVAIENTGRVIREVNADVFCVVEVDDSIALKRFNDIVMPKSKGKNMIM